MSGPLFIGLPIRAAIMLTMYLQCSGHQGEETIASDDVLREITAAGFHVGPSGKTPAEIAQYAEWNDEVSTKFRSLELQLNVVPSENLLISAPISVALLGYLVFLANENDFKLKVPQGMATKYFFEDMLFMTAILTVRTKASYAFEVAQTRMQTLHRLMNQLPGVARGITEVALVGDPSNIRVMLTPQLNHLKRTIDECSKVAKEPVAAFEEVLTMLLELGKIVENTKAVSLDQRNALARQVHIFELLHQNSVRMLKSLERELEELKEERQEAKAAYEAALKAIPTGWSAVFMDILRTFDITAIFQTAADLASNIVKATQPGGASLGASDDAELVEALAKSMEQNNIKFTTSDSNVAGVAERVAEFLSKSIDQLVEYKGNASRLEEFLTVTHDGLKLLLDRAKKSDSSLHHASLSKVVAEAMKQLRSSRAESEPTGLFKLLKGTIDGAESIATIIKFQKPILQAPRGNMKKRPAQKESNAGNERFVAEQTRLLFEDQSRRYKEHRDQVFAYTDKVHQECARLAEFKSDLREEERVVNATIKAIQGLNMLTMHWRNLVMFFQGFAMLVEHTLGNETTRFIDNVQVAIGIVEEKNDTLFGANVTLATDINKQGQKVAIISQVCATIADDYVKISKEHVVPALIEVSSLSGSLENAKLGLLSLVRNAASAATKINQTASANMDKLQAEILRQTVTLDKVTSATGQLDPAKVKILAIAMANRNNSAPFDAAATG